MTEGTKYLNTREAAAHLRLSTRTLDRYRVSGDGPVFLKFGGRVRYLVDDLDDWARGRRRTSTSDDGSGPRPAPAGAMLRGLAVAAIALTALLAAPEAALATSDTTFGTPLDTVEDIVGGTGGQLAAALAVGAALVGSVLRFNAMQLMGAVGVGIAAGAGTGIVTGLVGTAIV